MIIDLTVPECYNIGLIILRRAAEETEYQLQATREASYSSYRLVHFTSPGVTTR